MHIKKFPSVVAVFAAVLAVFFAANFAGAAETCNDHIIISQIYGGGGNSGAVYKNDFIELHNPSEKTISLDDWSIQYASASSVNTNFSVTDLTGIIEAGKYYLIQEKNGSGGTDDLPNPDATGEIGLATDKGKVALAKSTGPLPVETDLLTDPVVEDIVNYNGGTNTKSIYRNLDSCPNTFSTDTPNPRNSTFAEDSGETPAPDDESGTEIPKTYPIGIVINEIFPDPKGIDADGEFIELYNENNLSVDLAGWSLVNRTGNKFSFPKDEPREISAKGYLTLNYSDTKITLHNTKGEKIILKDPNDSPVSEIEFYGTAKEGQTYAKSGNAFFWTLTPTRGYKNEIKNENPELDEEKPAEFLSSAENIFLNEILPNPKKGSDDEYIEIANGNSEPVDLFGWKIKDASKGKGFQFKDHTILNPGGYFTLYGPDSKLALNNSNESVYLLNPKGEIVSSATFEKSQKNASYNFDGKNWKWSKYFTPGKKNKFDFAPTVKIKKPKKIYKNLVTEFSAQAKDKETKKLKYTWDFGDGKKSSLQKSSHKYLATGKYTVTLAVSDDSQTVEKSFVANVKNSPRPDLEIVKIVPNPAGNDSEGEIVEIKNNSSKKIDLAGCKIATGSGEKLTNHPISGEFTFNAGETKTITREFSKFSLNNKSGKVRLVMPDGKTIDEVEYSKIKISEDEAYTKIDGEWQWILFDTQDENAEEDVADEESGGEEIIEEKIDGGEVMGATDESQSNLSNYKPAFSSEDVFIFLSDIGFLKSQNKDLNYCPLKSTTASLDYFLISLI